MTASRTSLSGVLSPSAARRRWIASFMLLAGVGAARAATITVTSASDALAPDGACSLREAIASAVNNTAPFTGAGECVSGAAGLDSIHFAIPGAGVHTITPTESYPILFDPILLDGYTQAGASPNTLPVGDDAQLRIEIDASLINDFGLFKISGPAGGSTIRGLVVNHLASPMVSIAFNGSPSSGNVFAGNFIGTDPAGTTRVDGGTGHGLIVINGGTANVVGGAAPADRNLLVGGGHQVDLNTGAVGTEIRNNYFGLNAAGTQALLPPFANRGVVVRGPGTLIGEAGSGNVLVASGIGIELDGGDDAVVHGNRLGTDATGTVGLAGPGTIGVATANAPDNARIGGTGGAGNLISGWTIGVRVADGATDFTVAGNRIGTDAGGTSPVPNSVGIEIATTGVGSGIGDQAPGQGNVVAFNTGPGIHVTGGTGWPILGNSIFANGGLGILLNATGLPTPNDPGDVDAGPNDRQNYPVITFSDVEPNGDVTIEGTLDSTPSSTFRLELFASAACDVSGFGEGESFLGAVDVTTDAGGSAAFGPITVPVPAGRQALSATATNPAGSTSELSACVVAGAIFLDGFETGDTSRWSSALL